MEANTLSQEHQEFIDLVTSDGFKNYAYYYSLHTGKRLRTVDDLINCLCDDTITPEDLFFERMNHFKWRDELEYHWEDNMESFAYEVYFPKKDKIVGDGAWIKVRTENGYEVHWAKRSKRKIRYDELYRSKLKQYEKVLKSIKLEMKSDEIKSINDKADILKKELNYLEVRIYIGLQPYEVFYNRTKTQKRYLHVDQYEIVDVDEHIEYVMSNLNVVKVRNLFTAQDKDVIFYMQQRGIPKDLAMLMSNLKHCYFIVNIKEAIDQNNDAIKMSILKKIN